MRQERILFATTYGTGHFNPLLPYARELANRGHKIRVAARIELADHIEKSGFEHTVLAGPQQQALEAVWKRTKGLSTDEASAIYLSEIFGGIVARAAMPAMQEVISTWRPALVVRESVEFSSMVAAQAAGLPHARIEVHNAHSEEKYIPSAISGVDKLRKKVGLKPDDGAAFHSEPVFSFFPQTLDGTVSRRGVKTIRVGPSVSEHGQTGLDATWARRNSDPLIYVTFGTAAVNFDDLKSIYRTAMEAVTDLPVRVLLTTGKNFDFSLLGKVPPNVTVESWVPQTEVFPQASALVCHGGSGTMLGGLAAGLPMVITPLFADQPSNAEQVARIGAGIAVPNPDPNTLRSAIERLLSDETYRENARRIAKELENTPKIETAVDELLRPIAT